eukprot:1155672-Pelagomonas_calceolata.AAC.6
MGHNRQRMCASVPGRSKGAGCCDSRVELAFRAGEPSPCAMLWCFVLDAVTGELGGALHWVAQRHQLSM